MTKTYVITTAQRGATPHWDFLKSLETYCEKNKAELLILPTNGKYPSSTKEDQEELLHPSLIEHYRVIDHDLKLNNKIFIRNFPTKAQQMIPLTSWGRFVQYDQSAIMASPKLMLDCLATSNKDLPKILMSTGAVTHPNYKENAWGMKAKLDHKYSAIVLEVKDQQTYHYRQLVANVKDGAFYDLGTKYDGKKTSFDGIEALIVGDVHVGVTDPKVIDVTKKLMHELKPKHVLYHDLCDSYSISHWHDEDIVIQAQKARNGKDSLEDEVKNVGLYLKSMHETSPNSKHVVIKSNHDEMINRYLKEGRFIKDPHNLYFASKLLQNAIDRKKDTLEYAVELSSGKLPSNIIFLSASDDYKIRGWQLANHGHNGPCGARGTVRNLEGTMGRGIIGHFHSPEIFRDIWAVGTSTYLNLDYRRGAGNWIQGHGILHPNGKPQLVNIINGEYR